MKAYKHIIVEPIKEEDGLIIDKQNEAKVLSFDLEGTRLEIGDIITFKGELQKINDIHFINEEQIVAIHA